MTTLYFNCDHNPRGKVILKAAAEGNLVHAYTMGNIILCVSGAPISLEARARHYMYSENADKWVYQDPLTPTTRQLLTYAQEQGMTSAVVCKSSGVLLAIGATNCIDRPTHIYDEVLEDWTEV